MKGLFRRTDSTQDSPLDPERRAAVRRSVVWIPISYIPLVAGIAWAFFASGHWPGSRGVFLGVSGAMIGVAVSSSLFYPVVRVLSAARRPNRLFLGMSLASYTYVSIWLALAIAAGLAIAAFAIPQN